MSDLLGHKPALGGLAALLALTTVPIWALEDPVAGIVASLGVAAPR